MLSLEEKLTVNCNPIESLVLPPL